MRAAAKATPASAPGVPRASRAFHCEGLTTFVERLLRAAGTDADVAVEVARHLVRSDMSGYGSHGVLRLPQYFAQIARGELLPSARPRLVRDGGATLLVDGCRGFGHFSMSHAVSLVTVRARAHGVACAAVRRSTHVGRLGEYAERCQADGLVLLVSVGMAGPGVGGVAPFGGRERFMGANVWAIGVPGRQQPLVFDASMASVAVGRVHLARAAGTRVPDGCLIDAAGEASTDPEAYYSGGAVLPMGGAHAGHKAYGLALASALLGALCMIGDRDPTLAGAPVAEGAPAKGRAAGAIVVAIDPDAFGGIDEYRALVSDCLDAARAVAPLPGVEGVAVPGDHSRAHRARAAREGVRLPAGVCDALAALGDRFGVPMPVERGARTGLADEARS